MTALHVAVALQPAMTAAELRAWLGDTVDLPYNTERWTYAGVAQRFGTAVAEGIGTAMTAAGLNTAVLAYASSGFDLSLDETRGHLTAIAANVPLLANACNALKAIGRPTQDRWDHLGLAELPELAEIEAAQVAVATQQWAANVINEVIQPAVSEGKTIAEIKALVAASGV